VAKLGVDSVVLLEGRVVVYRRACSTQWQARFKIGGQWKRISTGCAELESAKVQAELKYLEYRFRHQHGVPAITRRFRDVAQQVVLELRKQLDAGVGKRVYVDYVSVLESYLLPFFGNYNVNSIGYKQLQSYELWREQQAGRALKASTITTHNSALQRVFDLAVQQGYVQRTQLPVLTNNGASGQRRADFTRAEYAVMLRAFPSWIQAARSAKSVQMRELLYDYVRVLTATGIRHGTEAQNLRWHNVEVFEERGRSYVALWVSGKTGSREVIGGGKVIGYLKSLHRRSVSLRGMRFEELLAARRDEPVFALANGAQTQHLRQTFKVLLEHTGLLVDGRTSQERTLYCLRHTYATFQLVRNGVDLHTLARQMGTSVGMLEKHYSHLTPRLRKHVLVR
jgi:integrase